MDATHPRRLRALVYFCLPVLLIILCCAAGLTGARMPDQSSHAAHVLGTVSGSSLIMIVIFTVPFLVYAVKYWRLKTDAVTLLPADTTPHDLAVQYSTSFFAKFFGSIFSGHRGTLKWVNSDGTLKLTSGDKESATQIFVSPFSDIEKFEVDLNMMLIKVGGKTYACFAYSNAIATSEAIGMSTTTGQAATIVLGTVAFQKAGIPELAERLRQAGVNVVYVNLKRSIEYGFDWGFGIIFLGILFVSVFLVR